MKNMKRFFCLLMLALFSLVLLTGCGSSDENWSDTNDIDGYSTITLNGEQIDVYVCHNRETVYIYYNNEEQELLDIANIPTDELSDDDWSLDRIGFDDLNGDGNSDLQVYLNHSDMTESCIIWWWEDLGGFIYQSDDSRFHNQNIGNNPANNQTENDLSVYKGIWLADEDSQFDYIEFDEDGYWRLYSGENEIDEGCLDVSEDNSVCLSSYLGGAIDGGRIESEGDRIYITTIGYFNYADGLEDYWYIADEPEDEEDEPEGNRNSADKSENKNKNNQNSTVKTEEYDGAYDWNEKLEQRNVSHFEGTWYLEAELWSLNYIIIDGSGNWSYYQRPSEDDEGTEMDYGTLTYSTNEERTYYAESDLYDGLRFKVVEFVEGIFDWGDDGTYYLMDGTEYDSYDWNAKLHQVNVSHFEGVWYYDYDPSADTYITIDGDGNWSYYQRASGNNEDSVIDYGTLTYSPDEDSMYYADSAMYDGVRYNVFWFDDKILIWGDEGAYYLMD